MRDYADSELTGWFPASTPPVRVGPYQVESTTGYLGWSWWNGNRFGACWVHVEGAIKNKGYQSGLHVVRNWRGLRAQASQRKGRS